MEKRIECEIYTRVCGYFRPKNQANKGKLEEINNRKLYDTNKIKDVCECIES